MKVDFTLLADGSSDRVLIPVIKWTFYQHVPAQVPVHAEFADLSRLRHRPTGLAERMKRAVDYYPCDILIVHRDAERADPALRREEIQSAFAEAGIANTLLCVVPVRMTEAWLLFNQVAIRTAAGNPNGRAALELPALGSCETVANPKELLKVALRTASELSGRRLKSFKWENARIRLSELIEDYSLLRGLPAFCQFEDDLRAILAVLRGNGSNGYARAE